MKIGILALQGAFAEHARMLEKLGIESVKLRNLKNFQQHYSDLSGLILPGGESTAIGKLLRELYMLEPIKQAISSGFPVFGTCAGLILLAKEITSQKRVILEQWTLWLRGMPMDANWEVSIQKQIAKGW